MAAGPARPGGAAGAGGRGAEGAGGNAGAAGASPPLCPPQRQQRALRPPGQGPRIWVLHSPGCEGAKRVPVSDPPGPSPRSLGQVRQE